MSGIAYARAFLYRCLFALSFRHFTTENAILWFSWETYNKLTMKKIFSICTYTLDEFTKHIHTMHRNKHRNLFNIFDARNCQTKISPESAIICFRLFVFRCLPFTKWQKKKVLFIDQIQCCMMCALGMECNRMTYGINNNCLWIPFTFHITALKLFPIDYYL